jgi:hypothetical protein
MAIGGHEEAVGLAFVNAIGHGHGLGRRRRLVQQGGVGQFHAGQIQDHLLVVEQDLEAALADLRLVGGIGRVPAGVLHHVAQDHLRHDRAVVAHADHRDEHPVALRHLPEIAEGRPLAFDRREVQGLLVDDRIRHRLGDQIIERVEAERRQHFGNLRLARPDVAAHEIASHLQVYECPPVGRHGFISSQSLEPGPGTRRAWRLSLPIPGTP